MAYAPILYDGTLPGPIGAVATALSTTEAATHRQNAIDLYQFFVDPDKVLLQLNVDHKPRTCIVGMPDSHCVRVLHAIGAGSSGIGSISLLDNNLLFLTGDGGPDIGTPLPLVLPPETLTIRERICLTQEQFVTQITAQGATHSFPLVRRATAANTSVQVMGIAPIPAFLVLDGVTTDLDAAIVLERVLTMDNTEGEMYTHLKNFLRCVLTGHNLGDPHCRVNQATLNAPIVADARRWANDKFKHSFPSIAPTATPTVAPDYAAILAPLLQAQMEAQAAFARGHSARDEEKKDTENESPPTLNMSPQEFNTTLLMCGLPLGSPPETLP
jgi:hypothetical protein